MLVGGQSWPSLPSQNSYGAGVGGSNSDGAPGAAGGPGLDLFGHLIDDSTLNYLSVTRGDASHSVLLVDVSGANRTRLHDSNYNFTYFYQGDGTGGGYYDNRNLGRNNGGFGAGGGQLGEGGRGGGGGVSNQGRGGAGGAGFVTVEFLEVNP